MKFDKSEVHSDNLLIFYRNMIYLGLYDKVLETIRVVIHLIKSQEHAKFTSH